jgi:hypothetical protein
VKWNRRPMKNKREALVRSTPAIQSG